MQWHNSLNILLGCPSRVVLFWKPRKLCPSSDIASYVFTLGISAAARTSNTIRWHHIAVHADWHSKLRCQSGDPWVGPSLRMLISNIPFLALIMVVKFVKISSKSTTEAVREKSMCTLSKKYVFPHQEANSKLKNYNCKFVKKYGAALYQMMTITIL